MPPDGLSAADVEDILSDEPEDNEILADIEDGHQCPYLVYRDWVCELVYPGQEGAQRWILRNADGLIANQALLFCPCCGQDFRADTWWQIPGRPGENEFLAEARAAGMVDQALAEPSEPPQLRAEFAAQMEVVVVVTDEGLARVHDEAARLRANGLAEVPKRGRYELLADDEGDES